MARLMKKIYKNNYVASINNRNTDWYYYDDEINFWKLLNQGIQLRRNISFEVIGILKPKGVVIVSFSNRMFSQKAIAIWRESSELARVNLVKSYLNAAKGFGEVKAITQSSNVPSFLQMLGIGASDPFYAVLARRETES
jgi:hypothetical protein